MRKAGMFLILFTVGCLSSGPTYSDRANLIIYDDTLTPEEKMARLMALQIERDEEQDRRERWAAFFEALGQAGKDIGNNSSTQYEPVYIPSLRQSNYNNPQNSYLPPLSSYSDFNEFQEQQRQREILNELKRSNDTLERELRRQRYGY